MIQFFQHHGARDDFSVGPLTHSYGFRIPRLRWGCAIHFQTDRPSPQVIEQAKWFGSFPPPAKRMVYLTWSAKDPAVYNQKTLWEAK